MSDQKTNWFARHKILTVILVLVILGAIGAASSENTPAVTTQSVSSVTSSNSKSHASTTKKSSATAAHVGATLDIGGSKGLAVTLNQIIDPASVADQYTTPDAGKRFVAVDVKIVNNGTATYNDDANSNIVLIGSDNQTYNFDPSDVSECTNFNDGQYTLSAGESTTGCVVFQVPDAVKTAKIQFQTNGGVYGSTGEWLVP